MGISMTAAGIENRCSQNNWVLGYSGLAAQPSLSNCTLMVSGTRDLNIGSLEPLGVFLRAKPQGQKL